MDLEEVRERTQLPEAVLLIQADGAGIAAAHLEIQLLKAVLPGKGKDRLQQRGGILRPCTLDDKQAVVLHLLYAPSSLFLPAAPGIRPFRRLRRPVLRAPMRKVPLLHIGAAFVVDVVKRSAMRNEVGGILSLFQMPDSPRLRAISSAHPSGPR